MLASNENRFQYVYFILSGIVATALIVLTYISVKTTAEFSLRDDLKKEQKTLNFTKPSSSWDYNNTWRYVGNSEYRHMIYSAYFDTRTDVVGKVSSTATEFTVGSFRIFTVLPRKLNDIISCIIRYEDYTLKETQAEEANPITEHHDYPFAVFTIMCPFRAKRQPGPIQLPKSIAIAYASNRLSHISPTFIPISYPRDMKQMFAKSRPIVSVCVGPLYGNYTDVMRVVEFVEMYRILGAEHFYFYNLESSPEVIRVLEYYRKLGLVDILPWNIDVHNDDVHYAAIGAQFNDCVYRAMVVDNFRYAAVVDFDEIIVPLKHNSLRDYLRQCDEGRTSGFIFRNVFYYKKDSNDSFSVPNHIRNRMLYSQTKVRRTLEIMPAYTRSKCVVNTRGIIEMGNHQVWSAMPGYSDTIVHQNVGLLFHYRDKCINCKMILITDYSARRFGSLIWDQVDQTCLAVFMERRGVCPHTV